MAAHAAIGMPIGDTQMPALAGGPTRLLADTAVNVLVFFRPNQERSLEALRELVQCQGRFAGKSVHWVGIVSDSAPAAGVAALVREAGFAAPVLVDGGDAFYGSLGLALHPVVLVVDSERRLAAFEPFRTIDYCALLTTHIRHALHEITDDEWRLALDPPKAADDADARVARSYRALAQAQFKAGHGDKALASVRKSLGKNPQDAAAQVLMGEILAALGQCPAAAEAYAKALAIEPGNAAAQAGIERCKTAR